MNLMGLLKRHWTKWVETKFYKIKRTKWKMSTRKSTFFVASFTVQWKIFVRYTYQQLFCCALIFIIFLFFLKWSHVKCVKWQWFELCQLYNEIGREFTSKLSHRNRRRLLFLFSFCRHVPSEIFWIIQHSTWALTYMSEFALNIQFLLFILRIFFF